MKSKAEKQTESQELFRRIFARLKNILARYSPPLTETVDLDSRYELYSVKDVELQGRKFKELFFGCVIIQGSYVGFYFMPVYTHTAMLDEVPEELRKCLKGKSCFHIKKYDEGLFELIAGMTARGFDWYRKEGLVDE
jgi:hypothetical protein